VREPDRRVLAGLPPLLPFANTLGTFPRDAVTSEMDLREAPFRRPEPRQPGDPARLGWLLVTVALALVLLMALSPSAYVIEGPGPVFDTLGSTGEGTAKAPLISISGAKTYETSGSLDLLTVQISGRTRAPNLLQVAFAWFDPSRSVQPLESVYPSGTSQKEQDAASRLQMANSQQEAVAAALIDLGYDIPRTLTVQSTVAGGPAADVLKKGDRLVSVNGAPADDLPTLRKSVAENGTGKPAAIGIVRDGVERTVRITPVELRGQTVVGVNAAVRYDFPVDVRIDLPNVVGPSGGMMFALGIYDKLTPGQLTGGKAIAGTGTIDAAGEVGAIGGIRQKMYGAQRAGASWFLAPKSNCDEVAGHVPDGMHVVAVANLKDAVSALTAISSGSRTSGLPTCAAR
jgi:PDZ domain-containing protein